MFRKSYRIFSSRDYFVRKIMSRRLYIIRNVSVPARFANMLGIAVSHARRTNNFRVMQMSRRGGVFVAVTVSANRAGIFHIPFRFTSRRSCRDMIIVSDRLYITIPIFISARHTGMFRIAAFRAGRGYCFVRVVMSCRGKIIICIFKPANLAKIGRITVLRTCRRGNDFRKYMPCFRFRRFRIRIPAYRTYIQDIIASNNSPYYSPCIFHLVFAWQICR